MLIGYAQAPADAQDRARQRAALKIAGCRYTIEEDAPGPNQHRPQLARIIESLRSDDVIVVTRLDQLAGSGKDLIDLADQLIDAGAGLRSLAEPWADAASPAGRMVLMLSSSIAAFEQALPCPAH